MKIIKYHNRTFTIGCVNLKIASLEEAYEATKHGGYVVADLQDGKVLLRPTVPSLIDVLINGQDTAPGIWVNWGPGNVGIDGSKWDFETEPTAAEVNMTHQIITACEVRRGNAPAMDLPYELHPVRGDPYRERGVLRNTRFGDIPYKTPQDTGDPLHVSACYAPKGALVVDGSSVVGTTMPAGFELYVPTIPYTVLEYLDSRPDMPAMYTRHGTTAAAEEDLRKYDLSTQGFVLPGVLALVRKYLHREVGHCPPLYSASGFPANNSMAGINGARFPTREVQKVPDIDERCRRAVLEKWQTLTPCTLKKQYCSKMKTRTILGTNNFIALAHRAALSGVTQGFMKKACNSPIALGKNKFKELTNDVCGRCLEADLASCDRSTPAIVRWFTTHLLYELAGAPEFVPSYVLNCCHDVITLASGAVTKRGGLSSGDPITSIANTVYSLIIYAQHMVLSCFKTGHPYGVKFLEGQLLFEDLLKLQPLLVYSDDLVLHSEPAGFQNYQWWVEHLDLLLGFKTDPKKTVVGFRPSFLGCRIENKRQLVPNRDRILAALGYHMKANTSWEYYASAAAILMDSCACVDYDYEWFIELIVGISKCARQDGFSFPGPSFFVAMWEKLRSKNFYEAKKLPPCGYCAAPSSFVSACGLDLCLFHSHAHAHCPVVIWCGHPAGSAMCAECASPVVRGSTNLDKVLEHVVYQPPKPVLLKVEGGYTTEDPGRYQCRRGVVMVRRDVCGNAVQLPDGEYQVTRVAPTCAGINMVQVAANLLRSKFFVGPPGSGKTHWLLSNVTADDVVYTPTHRTMLDIVKALGTCRFTIPNAPGLSFPPPSRSGPKVRILAAGYEPGRLAYLDESAYCNHLDVLKLLSRTPVVCLGDPHQLPPVGFPGPCYVYDLMPQEQFTKVYRFGQNICNSISKFYTRALESAARDTRVQFVSKPVYYGQVITPYHRDRVGDAITIDSCQGCTYDVVSLYLPTPKSLTAPRALVAVSRARHGLYIYDPHQQLKEFVELVPTAVDEIILYKDGDKLVALDEAGQITMPEAMSSGKRFRYSDPQVTELVRTLGLEGTASPLPQVAHNLGFYYSPDLPQFAKLPEELAPHWPVVTARNNEKWPDRLVASMRPLHKFSKPCFNAGYYVGPSIFLGVPGVISYYLTWFEKNEAQALPDTLLSTGRIATNCREFLDSHEQEFAAQLPHAFIGDTNGTTVGGCHHITSKYLPQYVPAEAVATIGVSCPGKAAKAKCTITDVYLPDFAPYLEPETASRDWKVKVDFRDTRLMVWKGKTAYFHEGSKAFPCAGLAAYSRYLQVPKSCVVHVDPSVEPFRCSHLTTSDWTYPTPLSVTLSDHPTAEWILTTTPPQDLGAATFRLEAAKCFNFSDGLGTTVRKYAYVYRRIPGSSWWEYNADLVGRLVRYGIPSSVGDMSLLFPSGEPLQPLL